MSSDNNGNTYIFMLAKFALASGATQKRTTEHVDTDSASREAISDSAKGNPLGVRMSGDSYGNTYISMHAKFDPYWSIQPWEGGWPRDWVNKLKE